MLLPDNKLIILVDDDEDDCYLFQLAIQKYHPDYNVLAITDSLQAIEQLEALYPLPDLILLDLYMPILGVEVLTQLRKLPRYESVPVAVLSGLPDPTQVSILQQMGIICVLEKPYTLDNISAIIAQLLE